jgi:TAP-like protein
MVNKSLNNIPINLQAVKMLLSIPKGSAWMELHPNLLEAIPTAKDLLAGISCWMATTWSGICDELTKVSNPILIITGTHDNNVPTANSLIIAGKIPGAWLVQIKDAGHASFICIQMRYIEMRSIEYYKQFFRPQQTLVDEYIICRG